MDPGTILTLAQLVLQVIDSPTVKKILCIPDFRSQLENIKGTVETVSAVLGDAEDQERQQVQFRRVQRYWLDQLRDAVYQADDLLDEVAFMEKHQQLLSGDKVTKQVRLFFSSYNQLAFARNMSSQLKVIRNRLDNIAKDRHDFGSNNLVVGAGRMTVKLREESDSHVKPDDVIGRDDDVNAVLNMLLDSTVEENLSFVTIVGIGGLGKTAVAQLVYNDERINREFPLKLWVCVTEDFDIEAIFRKVLESATNENPDYLSMDRLKHRIREEIGRRPYLLVLDDVWNEDRYKWLQLMDLLTEGGRGSRVLVTSRSKEVATIIGGALHELKGLSPKKSWDLFAKMAFEKGEE